MLEIIKQRHSVRQFYARTIEEEKRQQLNDIIEIANKEAGLHIQACFDEPDAFNSFMAHYGKFEGVTNYIALVAEKNKDEQIGYYGEQLVLKAQLLGLNSCWVALTYSKKKTKIVKEKSEKIYCVIVLGYGKNKGIEHKIKSVSEVSNISESTPDWFNNGVEASLYAPTAMNQQKFKFLYDDGKVITKAGSGFYTKIDLGIAKCHFEIGAGQKVEFIKK